MTADATAFLFTGQGSQFPGMGKDLAERYPAAREVFEQADEALGEKLSTLCFEGDEADLALTTNTQPATLTVAYAAFCAAGGQAQALAPAAAAGHSLGEYTALTAAGSIAFVDAVKLVRERARRMQEAVPVGTGGMVVLRKLDETQARELAGKVTAGVCDVANINAPGQVVLSGEAAAMDQVLELAGPRQAMKLAVSVPFHSSLLRDAADGFANVLGDVALQDAAFPIYNNVDAAPVQGAADIRSALTRQFAGSVLWDASVRRMLDDGIRKFVEFGPKATLVRMVTQIARAHGADVETASVTTADELEQFVS